MHLPCTCHAHPKVAIGLITANLVLSYPIVLNPPERALETTQGRTLKRAGGSGRRSTPSVEGGPLPPPTTASGARARRLQRRRFHRRQPSRLEVRLGLTRAWPLLGLRLLVRSSFMLLTAGIATVLTPPQVRAGAPLLCMRVCLCAPLSMSPLSSEPPFLSPLSAYTRCCTMLHPLPPPLRPRAPYCTLNLSTLTTVRPLPRPGLRLTSTFTVFILPCAFYLKLRGGPWSAPPRRMHPAEGAWALLILSVSVVGAGFGTVGAIQELVVLAGGDLHLSIPSDGSDPPRLT